MRRTIFGIIILAIGAMMLSRELGFDAFDWFFNADWHRFIIPGLIILVGAKLLFSSSYRHNDNMKMLDVPETEGDEPLKISTAFSGGSYNMKGKYFHGAKLEVMLGGIKMDLTDATIENGCVIDVHTFMGGVELIIPDDVNVEVNSSCLIGGVDSAKHKVTANPTATIKINANCFMGGVDIK